MVAKKLRRSTVVCGIACYAGMAEAEALVNMPEPAQESLSRDIFQKSIQQRRQLLNAVLAELETLEAEEKEALTGEDHEDPQA